MYMYIKNDRSIVYLKSSIVFCVTAMRLEAKRQQSKPPHERGLRHSTSLMEPIVGPLVEPRLRHNASYNRPAEESRSIHDQLDDPHCPSDRLHHCLCPSWNWRSFDQVRITKFVRIKNRHIVRPIRELIDHRRRPSSIDWTILVPVPFIFAWDNRIDGLSSSLKLTGQNVWTRGVRRIVDRLSLKRIIEFFLRQCACTVDCSRFFFSSAVASPIPRTLLQQCVNNEARDLCARRSHREKCA